MPHATNHAHQAFERIIENVMRLDKRACLRMRDTFPPGIARWYLDIGNVVMGHQDSAGFSSCTHGFSGETPEEAARNAWASILAFSKQPGALFLRYTCPSNVPIPGDDPQVWVRWSEAANDWEDVPPTPAALEAHRIPADRIRTYKDHLWREKL